MPPPIVDAVAVVALVAILAVAFAAPRWWVELLLGLVAAAAVVLSGAVGTHGALRESRELFPVVAFLAAILVVAETCAAEGVFAAVGARVSRASRGSPQRMLVLTFVAAAVVTAVLSLDATVVLLTPVIAAAAARATASSRPGVLACARLANSASVLLPVSNLTNLLALPALPSVSFLGFAALMAPVWLVVLAVEYAGHRLFFARELRRQGTAEESSDDVPLPAFPVAVVALMLVGFAALSPLGVAPAWVAGAAALVLGLRAALRGRLRIGPLLGSAQLPFAVFVLCLGVVVAGLARAFLGDAVAATLPSGSGLPDLLLVALVATVLANLVNNLPATLLLVPLVEPLGVTAVLAALVGLGVGSGLTYPGSLANLLWRRTVGRLDGDDPARTFHLLSAMTTLPAVVLGVVVLWAWAPVPR